MMELVGHLILSLNTAREQLAGAGIQTAALAFGGEFTWISGNRRI
jgi:hypothetical protein